MFRNTIKNAVIKAVGNESVQIDVPVQPSFGDYSSNAPMVHAKSEGKNPRAYAEELVGRLQKDNELMKVVEKIEIAGPGFLNFWIKKEVLVNEMQAVLDGKTHQKLEGHVKDKKIVLEYTDPNPFKEFHIGHLMPNVIGESLSRLFEATGADIRRVNYQGDVGMHVAKAIWGMQRLQETEGVTIDELEEVDLKRRVEFLGRAYVLGANSFEENDQIKEKMKILNKKIFEVVDDPHSHSDIALLYETGKKWSLEQFEVLYKQLGTKFDSYYFESEVGKIGKQIVLDHVEDGTFIESKGAIIFPGSKYGLHDRVFINSFGLPTYEAKELGNAPTKYKDFPYDLSFIITANEIDEYFKVLIQAMKLVLPELGDKTVHLSHGIMKLTSGKMSSRKGNVIPAEQLIEEVKGKVKTIVDQSRVLTNISDEEKDKTIEMIAIGAIKYAILKVSLGNDIIFDFENSISIEGNSGPYLQYTYARTQSVLEKAQGIRHKALDEIGTNKLIPNAQSLVLNTDELAVLRGLLHFNEVVEDAARMYAPNLLCNYLYELAGRYNSFYNKYRILEAEEEQKEFRLALTKATSLVLRNGLNLLGIQTPEKM